MAQDENKKLIGKKNPPISNTDPSLSEAKLEIGVFKIAIMCIHWWTYTCHRFSTRMFSPLFRGGLWDVKLPPENDFIVHSVFGSSHCRTWSDNLCPPQQLHPLGSLLNAGILHSFIINMVMRVNRWQAGQFLSVLEEVRSPTWECSQHQRNTQRITTKLTLSVDHSEPLEVF